MMLKIGRGASSPGPASAAQQLLDCHARIRSFLEMASALAHAHDPARDQVRDAAARVHRYFQEALPRHADDEDRSIAPRLRNLGAPRAVLDTLATIEAEHLEADEILARLLPRWAAVAAAPELLGEHRAALAENSAKLSEVFARHLEREESIMIPALDTLPRAAHEQILTEMRGRRG